MPRPGSVNLPSVRTLALANPVHRKLLVDENTGLYLILHVDRIIEALDIVRMSLKRKDRPYTASDSKRLRSSAFEGDDDSSSRAPRPKVDPTYGQRGAFPDIEIDNEEALFYGPASDGLEYLRMVR